jgi:LytS/YehU family sensor histidine kinase
VAVLGALAATRAADTAASKRMLQRLQLDQSRVARQAFEERLAALQARIEPAFLFETLRDIERSYEVDPLTGARMLDRLIAYLRAALPRRETAATSLRAEIHLACAWLEIVRARSEGRISFAVAVAEDLMGARVPPMLVAPLVSQAVAGDPNEERAVLVTAETLDDVLRIIVTGPADSFSPTCPPAVIQAIETRLANIYGSRAGIKVRRANDRSQAIAEIPYERTYRPAR